MANVFVSSGVICVGETRRRSTHSKEGSHQEEQAAPRHAWLFKGSDPIEDPTQLSSALLLTPSLAPFSVKPELWSVVFGHLSEH